MARGGTATEQDVRGDAHSWNVWVAVGLFCAWVVLAKVGPMFELAPGVRAWYPPAALLVAAVTLWGMRGLIPIVLAGLAAAPFGSWGGEPLWRVMAISVVLKGIYWLASTLLRRLRFDARFPRPSDVALFAVVYATAGLVCAIIAVIDLRSGSALIDIDALRLVRSYWVGDAVAVFALAPALLSIAFWAKERERIGAALSEFAHSRRDQAQLLSIPIAIAVAFALAPTFGFFSYVLCFLPLGWIAVVHGARVASLGNVILVVGALWSVAGRDTTVASLEVQAFTAMLTLTGLMIGSVAGEREDAIRRLGESEERYRSLVELLPDPVVVHADGRILFANGAANAVLGGADGSLVGRKLSELAAPSSRSVVDDRVNELAAGRSVPLLRHTFNKADGSGVVDLEAVSIPFDYEGRNAALTVARDVTARLRLEEELRHAQRMEAVGRLAGGIAHDFNNLLAVITSYSELLLGVMKHDDPMGRDVREIRQAADRAAALTRQLLSFSRRQVLQPVAVAFNDAVRQAEGLLRRLVGPDIEMASSFDPGVGTVLADPNQLDQVIMNLVVNARDAMPDGGHLVISTQSVNPADDPATARCTRRADRYVVLSVKDTGTGMDAATIARIFDPFFTTKGVGEGTGLGLATVHGIVEQAGGTVVVDSVPGQGTEFRIVLPELAGAVSRTGTPTSARSQPSLASGRVLLVEDEPAVRRTLLRTLRDAGYEVVEASDGVWAVSVLEQQAADIDIVLSDVAMPRMDGRELLRVIRVRWPSLPVVLMSGFADPETIDSDGAGLTLLLKPFTSSVLTAAIADALSRSRVVRT